MKVVIAPDSFKESLAGPEVAAAIAAGVVQAAPDAIVDLCPMADGGEGTIAAMVAATNGQFLSAEVFDPLGAPIRARFGLLGEPATANLPGEVGLLGAIGDTAGEGEPGSGEDLTAVIEMAAASGLALVALDKRDPLLTTTFGTGQLILAALDAGARRILIGIGGSATVDGGCGCAQALGVVFTGGDGEPLICGIAGGGVRDVAGIDLSDRDPRVGEASIRVACDVTNPLTGPNGAARVYGPQKGANTETVERLEANLVHLAEVLRRRIGVDVEKLPGAGAAGGLGAGLVAFAGASLEPGAPLVAEAVALRRRLASADLCITGEGRLDAQSAFGKTAVTVAEIARDAGVPTLCIPGQLGEGAPSSSFAAVWPLAGGNITARQAMQNPVPLLQRRAADALRDFLDKH